MIEIKTWRAKDKYTLTKRLHQYDILREVSDNHGICFYLVLWRWDGQEEWRLYPIEQLVKDDNHIVFTRGEGIHVPGQVPDWIPIIDDRNRH